MKAGEHFEFLSDDRAIRIKISHARWSSKFVCAEQDIKQGLDMLIGIEGPCRLFIHRTGWSSHDRIILEGFLPQKPVSSAFRKHIIRLQESFQQLTGSCMDLRRWSASGEFRGRSYLPSA